MPGTDSDFLPAIRSARIDRLDIYEISDSELQQLERGSPDSVFLTFSIFLFSTSLSFLIALLSTPIESGRVFTVFVVIAVTGAVGGAVLLALWRWYSRSRVHVLRQVRGRMRSDLLHAGGAIRIDAPTIDRDDGPQRA